MKWLPAILLLALPGVAFGADEIHWTLIGQTAVTFDWRGVENDLSYGRAPGVYTNTAIAVTPSPVPDGTGPFWEARLTGLTGNTLYYYRIGAGREHTFRTPPPRGSSGFWFAEIGDVGSTLAYPQVAPTQDSLAINETEVPGSDSPAFVIMSGDLTYGDQNGAPEVDQHFNDVMVWSQDIAYMPAWGNHEWDPAGSVKPDQIHNYKGRFDLPNPRTSPGTGTSCIQNDVVPGEDWYWFDYGTVRFINYPPGSEGTCGYSGARVDWRTRADSLMAAVDADPQIRFIVSFGHFPPYSSGADHGGDASRAADMAALRAAHPKYVLNIAGHSHHYERFDPVQTGGLLHVIGPGGGATLGGLASSPLPSTVVRSNHLEHLKLHVGANRIDAYVVCGPSRSEETNTCTPGTIIDSWSIVSSNPVSVEPEPGTLLRPQGWYDVQGRRVHPGPSGVYYGKDRRRVVIK